MAGNLFDSTIFGDAAHALEFIGGVLQASTEYSIIGLGFDGTILLWNEGARRLYGYEPEEVVGKANYAILHTPEDIQTDTPHNVLAAALKSGKWEGTVPRRHKNGRQFIARVVITLRREASGKILGYLLISRNISQEIRLTEERQTELDARTLAETALRDSEARYRIVAETATDAIISFDEAGKILFVNTAAERIFGYVVAEMLQQSLTLLIPGSLTVHDNPAGTRKSVDEQKYVYSPAVELSGRHRDGHLIPLEVSIGEYRQHRVRIFTAVVRDVTERKHAEEQVHYLAHHDALTGLPNRVLFRDRISQMIAQARRNRQRMAVLFLDLDGFKYINDSLGHQVGDELLRGVAERLRTCLRQGDSIGRLGGDEFVVSLPIYEEGRDAVSIAEKILTALWEPFQVGQEELHVSGSIGISLYPTDGEDAEALMRAADSAMYYAKEKGRNNYQFFTPRLNDVAQRRQVLVNRLHHALSRDEFTLVYQPLVELNGGKIFGGEALLRWHRPDVGLVLPSEFIRVTEETGLITAIGEWVLRQACGQLKQWRERGYLNLRIAVNLSSEQFRRPGLFDLVVRILRDSGVPAVALDFEITEGVLMEQTPENIEILRRLAGIGIQLAVDDFGTGYSSLAYLHRFPIDSIKIDRTFVHRMVQDANDSEIVSAIIAMAGRLKLGVIAEGVESAEQADFLRAQGCRAAQGFYYHEPVSAQAFGALLDEQSVRFS